MMKLNPYITFNGNARDALAHYSSVLGGEPQINTFDEFGDPPPGVDPKGVMHATLETDAGFALMVSDNAPGGPEVSGNNISVSISGDDADAMRGYFQGLSESGEVVVPLEKQMWGDEFGMVVDRFGINWMVNIIGAQ